MKHTIKKTLFFLTALIAVLALAGCGSKNTIDLTQYVQVNVSGADGYGCASADADDIGLEALLLSDDESDADAEEAWGTYTINDTVYTEEEFYRSIDQYTIVENIDFEILEIVDP